jgi:hypothetical protein
LKNLPKSEQNGFPDELAWLRLFALLDKGGENCVCQPCGTDHRLRLHELIACSLLHFSRTLRKDQSILAALITYVKSLDPIKKLFEK